MLANHCLLLEQLVVSREEEMNVVHKNLLRCLLNLPQLAIKSCNETLHQPDNSVTYFAMTLLVFVSFYQTTEEENKF